MLDRTRGIPAPEHREHTPTRNLHASHQRELAHKRSTRKGRTQEVRYGIRLPSGATVMALTDSEVARIRDEELANKLYDAAQRKATGNRVYNDTTATVDSWAHKR
jgi:hypothetical protein